MLERNMSDSPAPSPRSDTHRPDGRRFEKINFLAASSPEAEHARARLVGRYGDVHSDEADVVVALGGDGLMLQTLHRFMGRNVPIYGMNRGSVGFLMNEFRETGLRKRLAAAQSSIIHPLTMIAENRSGEQATAHAINEVSLLRQSAQAAKLRVYIDGHVRLEELVSDGVLVSTPAGSTAYNLSANGPILPLGAPLMALTPISAFRPRRWRGALLSDKAEVVIEVLEADKRPVAAVADHYEFRDVARVRVTTDHSIGLELLHDPGHSMEERILREQFRP
jgi:NAD+ kinase